MNNQLDNKEYDIIFDIGSNVGIFTDKCLELLNPSKIILVEANPNLYESLKQKYSGDSRIEVLNFAVSSKSNEKINFYLCNDHVLSTASIDWMTKSRFGHGFNWTEIKINTITLDDLIQKYGTPNLMKVDVEGYELEVFKGLGSKQEKICFEWAEEEYGKLNQIIGKLESLGYDKFGFTYDDKPLDEPKDYTDWNDCKIHNDINLNRKYLWGMVWAK